MSEAEKEEEPSMEEILASIRRIISEDDEEPDAVAKVEPAAEPEAGPEPEAEVVEEEDVLVLTEDDLEEAEEIVARPAMDMGIDDVYPAEDEDALVSSEAGDNIMGQFDALSALLTTGYQGSGNTLEDLVRELLRPVLKEWLDANLPEIAERMVAKEIARLARTKKP